MENTQEGRSRAWGENPKEGLGERREQRTRKDAQERAAQERRVYGAKIVHPVL